MMGEATHTSTYLPSVPSSPGEHNLPETLLSSSAGYDFRMYVLVVAWARVPTYPV